MIEKKKNEKPEYFFLHGKVKWYRPEKPNEWNKWEHVLYPDEQSLNIIRDLQVQKGTTQGIKNILKKDDDGYYMRIGRPSQKMIRGKVVGYAPPLTLDKDGITPLRNVNVGNGSDVTTKVSVYRYATPTGAFGRAMRWESTRIDNLIPWSAPDFNEKEAELAKDLDKAPRQEAQF